MSGTAQSRPEPFELQRSRRSIRMRALGLRIDALVAEIQAQRTNDGHVSVETTRAFLLSDAAFGRLFDDPKAPLPDGERHQLAVAMNTYVFALRTDTAALLATA